MTILLRYRLVIYFTRDIRYQLLILTESLCLDFGKRYESIFAWKISLNLTKSLGKLLVWESNCSILARISELKFLGESMPPCAGNSSTLSQFGGASESKVICERVRSLIWSTKFFGPRNKDGNDIPHIPAEFDLLHRLEFFWFSRVIVMVRLVLGTS